MRPVPLRPGQPLSKWEPESLKGWHPHGKVTPGKTLSKTCSLGGPGQERPRQAGWG